MLTPSAIQTIPGTPVESIHPVDGWMLLWIDERDSDGFWTRLYVAHRDGVDVPLNVSRFHFRPSQDRFAWLVRNGFPSSSGIGPWTDALIDAEMRRGDEISPRSSVKNCAGGRCWQVTRDHLPTPTVLDPVSYDLPGEGADRPRVQAAGESLHIFLSQALPLVLIGASAAWVLITLVDAASRLPK